MRSRSLPNEKFDLSEPRQLRRHKGVVRLTLKQRARMTGPG